MAGESRARSAVWVMFVCLCFAGVASAQNDLATRIRACMSGVDRVAQNTYGRTSEQLNESFALMLSMRFEAAREMWQAAASSRDRGVSVIYDSFKGVFDDSKSEQEQRQAFEQMKASYALEKQSSRAFAALTTVSRVTNKEFFTLVQDCLKLIAPSPLRHFVLNAPGEFVVTVTNAASAHELVLDGDPDVLNGTIRDRVDAASRTWKRSFVKTNRSERSVVVLSFKNFSDPVVVTVPPRDSVATELADLRAKLKAAQAALEGERAATKRALATALEKAVMEVKLLRAPQKDGQPNALLSVFKVRVSNLPAQTPVALKSRWWFDYGDNDVYSFHRSETSQKGLYDFAVARVIRDGVAVWEGETTVYHHVAGTRWANPWAYFEVHVPMADARTTAVIQKRVDLPRKASQ